MVLAGVAGGGACTTESPATPSDHVQCELDGGSCSPATDAADPCALTMPLSGDRVVTVRASSGSCGQLASSLVVLADGLAVSFHLKTLICPGDTGEVPLDSITVTARDDAGIQTWTTPSGACAMTLESNVCQRMTSDRLVLSGRGHCSQPARPDTGNSGREIGIGDFTFTLFQQR